MRDRAIRRSMMSGFLFLSGGAGLLLTATGSLVAAATLNVANNGVDSATCGTGASRCRSISQAIANAAPGDTILVGAGAYGDLNGDGVFTPASGEEAAEVGFGCACMIKVDKSVKVLSRDGADATVLDATQVVAVVKILASGAVFGAPKHGFTAWRGLAGGIVVDAAIGVRVSGNVAKFNGTACPCPPGTLASGIVVTRGRKHVVSGNLSTNNNGSGFELAGTGNTLLGNVVLDVTGAGYSVTGSRHVVGRNIGNNIGGATFSFDGSAFVIADNVGGSGGGFQISGTGHTIHGNVSSANYGGSPGFWLSGSRHVFTRNAARGNEGPGLYLNPGSTSLTITMNDFYGNGRNAYFIPGPNCGIFNDSGTAIPARRNFWGAATGPGPDPADGACNGAGSSTATSPFLPLELLIPTFPVF